MASPPLATFCVTVHTGELRSPIPIWQEHPTTAIQSARRIAPCSNCSVHKHPVTITFLQMTSTLLVALVASAVATGSQVTTHKSISGSVPLEVAAIEADTTDSIPHLYTAADIDFMSGMIGHHAQAILISKWAPS